MKNEYCKKFITNSKVVHGTKYDYSLVDYVNAKTKVKIKCNNHGIFEQTPDNHLRKKCGCPKCNGGISLSKYDFINSSKIKQYSTNYKKFLTRHSQSNIRSLSLT